MKGEKILKKAFDILHRVYKSKDTLEKINLHKQFIKLVRKAAYLGNPTAQYELGLTYEDTSIFGINPNCDFVKAAYWYNKACCQNHADACNNLATLYEQGQGVEKNQDVALDLYKKAQDLGCPWANNNYKKQLKKIKNLKNLPS